MRAAALALSLLACGPAAAPPARGADATAETPPAPEPTAAESIDEPPPAPPPDVGRWACSLVRHPLVEFHRALLELRADGTFVVRHTNTSPEEGYSTHAEGTWTQETDALVLTPASGIRRRWLGDGHRAAHGEDVPFREWDVPLRTTPWRLTRVVDPTHGPALRVPELDTRVYPSGDEAPPPCDDRAAHRPPF